MTLIVRNYRTELLNTGIEVEIFTVYEKFRCEDGCCNDELALADFRNIKDAEDYIDLIRVNH